MPGTGMPPLAHWGLRVGATLLDSLIIAGPMYALGMGIFQLYKEGATGQSIGKKIVGISVRREADGSVLGFGMAFVRKLAHFLDGIACYIGYLWPLWDAKKQTFADKVCNTVVIVVPKG